MLRCPNCKAEIPDVSRFCLSCGKEIPPPTQVPMQHADDADPDGHAMLLFALSFMMFFFALVPIFLGLWEGAVLMAAVGMALVGAGVYLLRSNEEHIEKTREEEAVKVKCQYCGMLNEQTAQRCDSCGATL